MGIEKLIFFLSDFRGSFKIQQVWWLQCLEEYQKNESLQRVIDYFNSRCFDSGVMSFMIYMILYLIEMMNFLFLKTLNLRWGSNQISEKI